MYCSDWVFSLSRCETKIDHFVKIDFFYWSFIVLLNYDWILYSFSFRKICRSSLLSTVSNRSTSFTSSFTSLISHHVTTLCFESLSSINIYFSIFWHCFVLLIQICFSLVTSRSFAPLKLLHSVMLLKSSEKSTLKCSLFLSTLNTRISLGSTLHENKAVLHSWTEHFTFVVYVDTNENEYIMSGLGKLKIPLVSDLTKEISTKYGVLYKDTGHTLR